MSFLNVLGKVLNVGGAVAPTVASAVNPAAGALVGLVVNAVTQAEQAGGTGAQKKAAVMQSVVPAAAGVVGAALQAKGSNPSLNSTQLTSAVSSLVDGTVSLLNSVQSPATTSTAASASAPATTPAGAGTTGTPGA